MECPGCMFSHELPKANNNNTTTPAETCVLLNDRTAVFMLTHVTWQSAKTLQCGITCIYARFWRERRSTCQASNNLTQSLECCRLYTKNIVLRFGFSTIYNHHASLLNNPGTATPPVIASKQSAEWSNHDIPEFYPQGFQSSNLVGAV